MMKNASLARFQIISLPENWLDTARVESKTIRTTAMRSWTIRLPKTSGA